jgi:hypothetical protein
VSRSYPVKYLSKARIEQAATALIHAYAHQYGLEDNVPVPVDSLLECSLGLTLEIGDLTARLGLNDVLGATWIESRTVMIDQSLEPTDNPLMEGRFNFTLAHEIGHWQLHRTQICNPSDQQSLFDFDMEPTIVCRTSQSKEPMEWQADCFAGYLLMPADRVRRVWQKVYGSCEPYVAVEEIEALKTKFGKERPTTEVARDMALLFNVSGQAMQIRLEDLGLVLTRKPEPDLFSVSSV